MTTKKTIDGSAFIKALVQTPSQVPSLILIQGYLAEATEPDQVRLYLDPALAAYFDIPETALKHYIKADASHDPMELAIVWLDREATYTYKNAFSPEITGNFFSLQASAYHGQGITGTPFT